MKDEVSIFISGDFAPTHRIIDLIRTKEYSLIYNDILPYILQADIAITNLELPLIDEGTPIQKTGPNLKAPVECIEALKFAGFNLLTLANNHIMDYGWEGLKSTIETCNRAGIDYTGVGENLEAAQKIKYKTVKEKVIAFINIAENEWSTTHGEDPGTNPLNEVSQFYQITEAKRNADYVIVIIHGGHESYGLPSPRMQKLYRYFVDLGTDAVIGHHTHCYCGEEIYKGKPIIYSLGNFIFDAKYYRNKADWNIATAVILKFTTNNIEKELIPFYQCNNKPGINLMNIEDKMKFFKESEKKTQIILDANELQNEFKKFINFQSKMYLTYLEPINNRLLLAIMNKGLLPRIMTNKRKRLLLNLIRTEAHRDVLMEVINTKKNRK